MLLQRWRIDLLGSLRMRCGAQVVTRFQSQKVAALLAYLAFYPCHPHSRDKLVALLWPEDNIDAARNRLRVGLSSLRRQLEPPGTARGSVLMADRVSVHLNPDAFTTDTAAFESAADAGLTTESDDQHRLLIAAVDSYTGALLPGFYDEWVLGERDRLAQSYVQALRRLTRCLVEKNDYECALLYARRAVTNDPLREEAHRDVMRLYAALGQPAAAYAQYEELKRLYQEALDAMPSATTQQLAQKIADRLGRPAGSQARREDISATTSVSAASGGAVSKEPAGLRPRHNLPVALTRFFGRERELDAICALLSRTDVTGIQRQPARLVTLTGPGGMGKTRLAAAVGDRLHASFEKNIWFVPLADVSDAHLIGDAIAGAMQLARSPRTDPWQHVYEALENRPALLILDNCEQFGEDAAPLIQEMLTRLPRLTCLLTSRRSVGVPGEREIVVDPLPVPEVEEVVVEEAGNEAGENGVGTAAGVAGSGDSRPQADPEELLSYPAVQLFLDRARAVQPGFQLTAHNAADVASLCRELEGIPLALELAAARARVFTPGQMRAYLSRRFELLVNRRADKTMRHRSLRATIEWSYHLLSPDLRPLFAQLSAFDGGWNVQAAWSICRDERGLNHAVQAAKEEANELEPDLLLLDRLEQLRIDSLIAAVEADGEVRFRMLDSLREFAAEQLSAAQKDRLSARYVDYFVSLAEQAALHFNGAHQSLWLRRLTRELDNLRAACDICARRPAGGEMGLRLARALYRFWSARGLLREGSRRCAAALAHPGAQGLTPLRSDALIEAGALAADQDDFTSARELYQQALGTAAKIDYRRGIGRATDCLGVIAMRQSDYETANELFDRSMAIHREMGDPDGLATALIHRGLGAQLRERYGEAKSLYEQGLSLHTELGNRLAVATTLGNLGMIADMEGDYDAARSLHEQSLAAHRDLENPAGIAAALGNLAILAAKRRDYEQARLLFDEVHAMFSKRRMIRHLAILKGNMGSLERLQGKTEAACGLFQESLELHRQLNNKSGMIHALSTLGTAYIDLGDYTRGGACLSECLQACFETGQHRSLADALEEVAALSHIRENWARSAWFHGAANALRDRIDVPLSPEQSQRRAAIHARLSAALEDAALGAALADGRAALLEDVVREAAKEN